jgi:hypothetical protein
MTSKPDLLPWYLKLAERDLTAGISLPRTLSAALRRYGAAKTNQFDRANACTLMPRVEAEGKKGDDRYEEIARRLGRYRAGQPDARLIRYWWENRGKASGGRKYSHGEAEGSEAAKVYSRGRGRPKKK